MGAIPTLTDPHPTTGPGGRGSGLRILHVKRGPLTHFPFPPIIGKPDTKMSDGNVCGGGGGGGGVLG